MFAMTHSVQKIDVAMKSKIPPHSEFRIPMVAATEGLSPSHDGEYAVPIQMAMPMEVVRLKKRIMV